PRAKHVRRVVPAQRGRMRRTGWKPVLLLCQLVRACRILHRLASHLRPLLPTGVEAGRGARRGTDDGPALQRTPSLSIRRPIMANIQQNLNKAKDEVKATAGEVKRDVQNTVGDYTDRAKDAASNVTDKAREVASSVMDRAKDAASNLGQKAQGGLETVGSGLT